MEQRELHGGGPELDAVALADGFDLLRLLDQRRRRRHVVVRGAGFHAAGQDAGVVRSAQDDRDVPLHALRQELGEAALFEQCVAAGQQHAVEVAGLDEAQAGVALVDADADRADDAGLAQLVERPEARVHHRLEALVQDLAVLDRPEVDVVDQGDVDLGQAEPQVRMFERAHHAVVAVVELGREAGQAVVAEVGRLLLAGPERMEDAADLGRQDELVARLFA